MPIENEEIVEIWKNEKDAWDSKDADRIIEARLGSKGFGARNITWRECARALRSLFDSFYKKPSTEGKL